MITPNATALQAAHVAVYHVKGFADRQARYAEKFAQKPILKDESVVLDSTMQRVFRLRKGILTASRLINARLGRYVDDKGRKRRWSAIMVTMTYRDDVNYEPEHVSDFINTIQKYAARRGYKLPYAWVMELTEKGKPHYHMILWIPSRWNLPKPDTRGWWPHGATNVKRAKNAYGYLAKYASKCQGPKSTEGGYAHQFPRGARIHGIGGLTASEAAIVAWWKLPKDLRRGAEGSHKWRRMVGGGWKCIAGEARGEIYDSGWGLSAINCPDKRVRLCKKAVGAASPRRSEYDRWRFVEAVERSRVDRSVAERSEAIQRLQTYRASLVWGGGGPGYANPSDAPSLDISFLLNPLAKYCSSPLPF